MRRVPPATGTDMPRSSTGNRCAAERPPRCPQGGGGLGEVGHPQGSRSRNKCAAPGPTKRNKRAACRGRNGYAATRPPNEEQMRRRRSDQEEQIRRRRPPGGTGAPSLPAPRGNGRAAKPSSEGTDTPQLRRKAEQMRRIANRAEQMRRGRSLWPPGSCRQAGKRNRYAALTRAKRNSYAARLPSSRGTDAPRNRSAALTLPPPRARAPRCRA